MSTNVIYKITQNEPISTLSLTKVKQENKFKQNIKKEFAHSLFESHYQHFRYSSNVLIMELPHLERSCVYTCQTPIPQIDTNTFIQ